MGGTDSLLTGKFENCTQFSKDQLFEFFQDAKVYRHTYFAVNCFPQRRLGNEGHYNKN